MPRYRSGSTSSTSSASTGTISENAVVYRSAGGHSHDGLNSSLIDMSKYTVWDFDISTIYTNNSRYNTQLSNVDRFKNFITNHVANDVLGPAGITLGDNIINARNIIAGSITTDLLATNAITSLNYSYTSGNFTNSGTFLNLADGSIRTDSFYLDGSGNMYIAGDVVIGATAASTIESGSASGATSLQPGEAANDVNSNTTTISGGKIRTGEIESTGFSWNGSTTFSTTGTRIDLDDGQIIGKQFRIDSSGNATFAGAVSGATITIGSGNNIFRVNSSGDMWLGHATETSAPFRVVNTGALTATSATITGTINATSGYLGNSSYGFNITAYSNYARVYSNDNTGSSGNRGSVDIRSYGDIFIKSTPTDGSHANQQWKTELVGEWIKVYREDGTNKPFAELGNFDGDADTISLNFWQTGSLRSSLQMLNGYGILRLYDTSGVEKINISGANGDATFARDVTVSDDLTVGDDCTVGGNFYASINNTNAIRTIVNTSAGSGVIRTGSGNAYYTPITIDIQNGGLYDPGAMYNARYMISFYDYGSAVGNIHHNGTSAVYASSSDYRLKKNVETIINGLEKIKQIKPRYYDFINNEEAGRQIGFIAHELQEVVPQAAFGVKDAIDEDGKPILQQVEKAAIVPYLVAAVQELSNEIEDLKAQIESFSN